MISFMETYIICIEIIHFLYMTWWKFNKNLRFNAGESYGLHWRLKSNEDRLVNHEETKANLNINRLCSNLNTETSNINIVSDEEIIDTKPKPNGNK